MTAVEAIPVTTPARTLIDLAAVASRDVVEEALDDALRRRLLSLSRLRRRVRELGRKGRPGITLIRSLLVTRERGGPVPQSVFETRLFRVLGRADFKGAVTQHEIRDRGRIVAVVDVAFPDAKVAIEADGYRWHSGRARWEHDLARRNELTALGWRVIHVTWTELRERPETVVAAIKRTLSERTYSGGSG